MQAVRSADYAIAQFRFLETLMLVHGRNNYKRISVVVMYPVLLFGIIDRDVFPNLVPAAVSWLAILLVTVALFIPGVCRGIMHR